MKHTVLARKWRPKQFNDLIGQQNCVKVLTNIISSGRLHHAYLLTGTRGVGKTTIARIIAKALNCLNSHDGEPCGICENCLQIDRGSFVDVIEIDAASNTGVDNIRELIDNAQYAPTCGQYKIYIIDEVHMLSKSAFNAMLKTLEEPPAHVVFILATTDLQKVPITVISRCLQLKLRNLLASEISKYLAIVLQNEQNEFENDAIDLIAKAANGSMRDALSILDQAIAFSDKVITTTTVRQMLGLTNDDVITNLLNALANLNSQILMQHVESIYHNGYDFENILLSLQQKLCEINLIQLAHYPITLELQSFIQQISINDVQLYFEIANLGLEQLRKSADKYPVFVMTMLRMLAFHIGTSSQKNNLIQASNFNSNAQTKPIVNEITEKKSSAHTTIQEQESQYITNKVTPTEVITHATTVEEVMLKKDFNGNWINLVIELKEKLGEVLFPFAENAKLTSYNTDKFNLLVDQRYQSAFDDKIIVQLQQILSTHFARPITVNLEFAASVDQTLKEKTTQELLDKQQAAQEAIKNDDYLTHLCSELDGKIVTSGIKPIN